MRYTFNSLASLRSGRGRVLLDALYASAPEVFDCVRARVLIPEANTYNEDVSGLFIRSEGIAVQTVAILYENKVDRIYTVPRFRRKGYAKEMLVFLRAISMVSKFSFISPVNLEVIPLFKSAGWWRCAKNPNTDGTQDMIAYPPTFAAKMDMGRWLMFVEELGTVERPKSRVA